MNILMNMNGELVSVDSPKALFSALKEVKRAVKEADDVSEDGIALVSCPEHLRPEIEKRISEIKEVARKRAIQIDDEEILAIV